MTNYANWYAYYRTRVLAAKTTSSLAFNFLDSTYRVGFHTLNTPATNWVDVNDWTAAQRNLWYPKLFGVGARGADAVARRVVAGGRTLPHRPGGAGSLPAMPEGYIPASATDPVTVSCQKNYHIYFTDGYTNKPVMPSPFPFVAPYTAGEVDGAAVPVFSARPGSGQSSGGDRRRLASLDGNPWPNPYLDPIPTAGTLADISLYYWMNNLRPAAFGRPPFPRPTSRRTTDAPAQTWCGPTIRPSGSTSISAPYRSAPRGCWTRPTWST